MVHQHGQSHHLVRRQRDAKRADKTIMVTLPNTFTGDVVWVTQTQPPAKTRVDAPVQPTQAQETEEQEQKPEPEKTLLAPATREPEPKQTSTAKDDDPKDDPKKDPDDESAKPTATPKPSPHTPSIATASTFEPLSPTHAVAFTSSSIGGLAAATSSSIPSPSASSAAASSGMSGGAKAGLALGVLVGIGALLGAILFVYHRKKKQATEQNADDEKFSMRDTLPTPPPPHVEPAPSVRTMSTAPRLSLRPVTQFDPMLTKRKSGGNMLDVAAAGAVANPGDRSPSSDRPATSHSWERFGANNASTASVNPFNDPQPPSVSPPQDPFSNSAAIEEPKASPKPVQQTAPPNADFGNPAPAIAAAEAASLMAALPAPPSKANLDSVPPSPAWTEDIPASPGPAPSGPLPVAAAGGPANGAAPNNVHRVQLDFKPSMSDELGLHAGQLVRMLHEYDDGWALCVRMDRSQQGVVPRTCLSKHPVKPRQGPPGPRMRRPPTSPPMNGPMNHGRGPQPGPLTPRSGRNSPHPPALSPANGRMCPAPRSGSPGPRQMPPPQGRARSNSNAPYAGPPRSMSPGPYGGGPQMAPPPPMGRPRSNSAGQPSPRRGAQSGPSRMNPNAPPAGASMPHRKPLPGQAL